MSEHMLLKLKSISPAERRDVLNQILDLFLEVEREEGIQETKPKPRKKRRRPRGMQVIQGGRR